MISPTMMLILGGCLLGAIQLIAGVGIGLWARRNDQPDAIQGGHEMRHASDIAKRLQTLADEMSSSVGEHRNQLEQATHVLTSENGQGDEFLAELVVDVIDDIVRANQNLQSKLDTAENRLEEQAAEIEAHISRSLTDPLTGLPNRREFNDRLEERMAAWNRRGEEFSLMLLDVDHFKKLNDSHGHLVGDQVLATLGRTLRKAVRREDAVARYGGEEFAILLPNTALDQAIHVAEKVRSTVAARLVRHNELEIAITVSAGLAMISPNESTESLIQRADAALYMAKAAGRNCAFVHDGIRCRAADGFHRSGDQPTHAAGETIEQNPAPDAEQPAADEPADFGPDEFGTYLPREAISLELAETCDVLRQYLRDRQQHYEAVSPSPGDESTTS